MVALKRTFETYQFSGNKHFIFRLKFEQKCSRENRQANIRFTDDVSKT